MDHRMAKSKSLSSLTSEDIPCHGLLKIRSYNYGKFRRMSDSSVEVLIMNDSASEGWCDDKVVQDSGLGDHLLSDGDVVEVLERKFDKLQELFQEQCQLLSSIKQQMQTALRSQRIVDDSHHTESPTFSESLPDASFTCEDEVQNVRARSLLDAIERKQASCLDRVVKDALTDLLNSDDLKQQLVSATVSLLQDKMAATLSRDMAAVYLPLLQRFNRKLLRATTRTLEDAFAELEENSNMCRFANSAARALRRALGVHRARVDAATAAAAARRAALHDTISIVLKSELSRWRSGLLCVSPALAASAPPTTPAADDALASPPQPPNPDTSIIDQLMMSAEINKQIQDGDIAGSLTRALCANDLSLVVAACRGIDPERVFRPCTLPANILLSLVQQLATDMVHDTQLKCRYLEESLIALGSSDMAPVRAHLRGVCGDVRAHLTHFLQRFPAHAAATRLNLILMAVDALMK